MSIFFANGQDMNIPDRTDVKHWTTVDIALGASRKPREERIVPEVARISNEGQGLSHTS